MTLPVFFAPPARFDVRLRSRWRELAADAAVVALGVLLFGIGLIGC